MPARLLAGINLVEHVAPPLQPHQPQHRFAHIFADARDLIVEGIKRENASRRSARREQSCLIAVAIVAPQLRPQAWDRSWGVGIPISGRAATAVAPREAIGQKQVSPAGA